VFDSWMGYPRGPRSGRDLFFIFFSSLLSFRAYKKLEGLLSSKERGEKKYVVYVNSETVIWMTGRKEGRKEGRGGGEIYKEEEIESTIKQREKGGCKEGWVRKKDEKKPSSIPEE
jgi:hypothetical protein